MLKLSSNNFYKNHSNELIKFYNTQFETLHIINGNDQSKSLFSKNTTYFVKDGEDVIDKLDKSKLYDQLILTNFIENSQDFVKTFPKYEQLLSGNNKVIISSINSKWNIFVVILSTLKVIKSKRPTNYITKKTIENTFKGFGYTLTKNYTRQIFPFKLFYIGTAINIILEILFFRFNLGLKSYFVFVKNNSNEIKKTSKTLLIPAKNEEGNLDELISRINLDTDTQIIFIIAKSKDKTLEKALEISKNNKKFKFLVLEQNSNGKKNAVNEALPYVENELVAILDSDISVDPEELNNFFEIIEKDLGDFVNGTRLIYSMEKGAMRLLNNFGNRIFQKFVSFVIKENITDTLCGTKVFKKELVETILLWDKNLFYKDPFGDFNFIFAASSIGERIVDYPIHYRSRRYGSPQISRFRDGYKLFLNFLNSIVKLNASKY
jgi:hypothetical protein